MLADDEIIEIPGIDGVLIYRDDQLKNKYYYTSTQPRVAQVNGNYQFTLIQYTNPIKDQAGVLAMVVDLSLSPNTYDRVINYLKTLSHDSTNPNPNLTPIPWLSGTVVLCFEGGQLIHSQPSLIGTNAAVFQIELSIDQFILLQQSLDNNQRPPISIVYGLIYETIRPAYECQVTMDWEKYRDYIEKRCRGGFLIINFESTETFEELKEEQVIKIECINYQDGNDPKFQLDFLKSLSYLFTPLPMFAPPSQGNSGKWTLGYSCQEMEDIQTIQRQANLNMNIETAVSLSANIQGNINDFHEAYQQNPIQEIPTGGESPFQQYLTVNCYADYEKDSIISVEVRIYKRDKEILPPYWFSKDNAAPWSSNLLYDLGEGEDYTYTYKVQFKAENRRPLSSENCAIARSDSFLNIIARNLYTFRTIPITVSSQFPWQYVRIIQVKTKLSQEDPDPEEFYIDELNKSSDWDMFSSIPNQQIFHYRATYIAKTDNQIIQDWREATIAISLNLFTRRAVKFSARNVNWLQYEEIQIIVKCQDSNNALNGSTILTLTASETSADWEYYYINSKQQTITYKTVFSTREGSLERDPESTNNLLVIISDPQI